MFILESKLIKAVQIKSNEESHELADKILKNWEETETNIRSRKNTIIQLLGIFCWNQVKNISDPESLKYNEIEKNKLLNKLDSDDSENLNEIFHEIVEYYTTNQNIFTKGCENPLIKRTLDYIYNNSEQKISLDILSDHLHISKSYLSTLICQNTGTTLPNILATFRIEKSLLLLTYTDKSISEISKELGFQSDSYFCQQFKNIKQITPKKFRTITKRDLY
ncbi:helix-turn-helix transcriptional regulator [Finegoldia magna]|uniref:helix-turn-helix transcriptional regulator n=1 Tax=Finegoldia magna TaxID=1260 RepID=UPI003999D742